MALYWTGSCQRFSPPPWGLARRWWLRDAVLGGGWSASFAAELGPGSEDDSELCSGLLPKRPDALAVCWGKTSIMTLGFTRGYDWRQEWHTDTDQYSTEWFLPLRDKLLHCPGNGWSMEIVTVGLSPVALLDEEGSWTVGPLTWPSSG